MIKHAINKVPVLCLLVILGACGPGHGDTGTNEPAGIGYVLPEMHSDNTHPLKDRFFQEAFRDLDGRIVQLSELHGKPLVICVYSSFLTDDGRRSLLGLEALLEDFHGRFITAFIPVEDRDIIQPSIKQISENMLFLFRAGGDGTNLSLVGRYGKLFWNHDIIAADFPLDKPETHYTSPFYWIIDENGVIREKLIDYSDSRGVGIGEVREVLNALLGPGQDDPSAQESQLKEEMSLSTAGSETDLSTSNAGEHIE